MIVGHGLVATAFIGSVFESPHYTVFASGISNSTESADAAFIRELTLLQQYLAKSKTLIYFSTTSIFDPTKQDTPYILHKLKIEKLIRERAEFYMIVRLPILVGRTSNSHTLINYLVDSIREKREIRLHTKACRHLLDVDDLVPVLTEFYEEDSCNRKINILGSPKITVPELVEKIESVLDRKGVFTWEDEGACYDVPENEGEIVYIHKENYIETILKKYFG